jgi:hypothetical protein
VAFDTVDGYISSYILPISGRISKEIQGAKLVDL